MYNKFVCKSNYSQIAIIILGIAQAVPFTVWQKSPLDLSVIFNRLKNKNYNK